MQDFLIKKRVREAYDINPLFNKRELANELGVPTQTISATVTWLKREVKVNLNNYNALINKIGQKISNKNTYNNHEGTFKTVARDIMVAYITSSKIYGDILTLPSYTWAIEKLINKLTKRFYYIAIERDIDTFKLMKKEFKQINLKGETHNAEIKDFLYGKHEDTYSHMILDYCGTLSTIAKELEYTFDNNLVKVGGYICVTFNKAIRSTGQNIDYLLNYGSYATNFPNDNRCEAEKTAEAFFNSVKGKNHRLVEIYSYTDTSPMMLVVLQRIK